jgi:hypothetical protein
MSILAPIIFQSDDGGAVAALATSRGATLLNDCLSFLVRSKIRNRCRNGGLSPSTRPLMIPEGDQGGACRESVCDRGAYEKGGAHSAYVSRPLTGPDYDPLARTDDGAYRQALWASAQRSILQSARKPLRLNTPILGSFTAKSL